MRQWVLFALVVCLALAGLAAGDNKAGHDEPKSVTAVCGSSSATVSWEAVVDPDLRGYDVYQSSGGSGYVLVTPAPVTTTSHTVTGLAASTTYSFGVNALFLDGHSSQMSVPASCTTN